MSISFDFIRVEGADVRHAIAEARADDEVLTVCGRVLTGVRVTEDDGDLCGQCEGKL